MQLDTAEAEGLPQTGTGGDIRIQFRSERFSAIEIVIRLAVYSAAFLLLIHNKIKQDIAETNPLKSGDSVIVRGDDKVRATQDRGQRDTISAGILELQIPIKARPFQLNGVTVGDFFHIQTWTKSDPNTWSTGIIDSIVIGRVGAANEGGRPRHQGANVVVTSPAVHIGLKDKTLCRRGTHISRKALVDAFANQRQRIVAIIEANGCQL